MGAVYSPVYRFEVTRWPAHVRAPIAGVPPEQTPDETVVEQKRWRLPKCCSLPVAAARTELQGQTFEKPVSGQTAAVSLGLTLKMGTADVRATLLDKSGKDICSAYFVYIRRG